MILLAPAALTASVLRAQKYHPAASVRYKPDEKEPVRLPNGKKQMDEILKDDYEKNLKTRGTSPASHAVSKRISRKTRLSFFSVIA